MKTDVGVLLVEQVLQRQPPVHEQIDLHTLLQALYDRRFTGPVTLHFRDGKPLTADLPTPKIRLTP